MYCCKGVTSKNWYILKIYIKIITVVIITVIIVIVIKIIIYIYHLHQDVNDNLCC